LCSHNLRTAMTPRRPHRPIKRFTFQRDTAFQLALRLTMRRIAATLAVVVALLLSAVLVWTETEQQTISKATAVAEKRGFG